MTHPLTQDFTHRHAGRQLTTPQSTPQAIPLRKATVAAVEDHLSYASKLDRNLLSKAFRKGLKIKSSAGQSISVVWSSTEFSQEVGNHPRTRKLNADNALFNELLTANDAFFISPNGNVLLKDSKSHIPVLTHIIMENFSVSSEVA